MKIIRKDFTYLDNIDILIRIYKNQDIKNADESKQICSEILFKKYIGKEHIRSTSWLPRGAVAFIVKNLNKLGANNYNIQISNELEDNIGVLTSCRNNFDDSLEWKLLN